MGAMMNYTDGHIVRLQLAALDKLGLRAAAQAPLERFEPALGALWAMGEEAKYNYDAMGPSAVKYLHYELQTAAVMAFRNHLSSTGSLADLDQETFVRAFGDLPEIFVGGTGGRDVPLANGFMAFAWDPDRLDGDGMWAPLDERIEQEWAEAQDFCGRFHITFPSFLWEGFTDEQKRRTAVKVMATFGDQLLTPKASATPVKDRLFRGRRRFAMELLSYTIAPYESCTAEDGVWSTRAPSYKGDHCFSRRFTLTPEGFIMEFALVDEGKPLPF